MTTITIDGSRGEGGGQIIRNACALAAILRKNVSIVNIRAGRKTPGLRPQHLVGLRLLAAASGAVLVKGDFVGSTEIVFLADNDSRGAPNNSDLASSGNADRQCQYVGDTQTAGSVCLLLQTVLPFAFFRSIVRGTGSVAGGRNSESSLHFLLKGGTDTDFAPPLDYFRHVFLPVLENSHGLGNSQGVKDRRTRNAVLDVSLSQRGFFPRGGGVVHATICRPSLDAFPLRPIRLTERGGIVEITIRAFAAGNCPRSMAERLSATVEGMVASNSSHRNIPIRVDPVEESPSQTPTNASGERRGTKRRRAVSSGCGVLVVAKTDTGCLLGGSSIGSPKISLEESARVAAQQVIEAMEGGGCVDDYLQDQLILYMALAEGVSEVVTNALTLHTRTAIWVASQMLPSVLFQVTKLGENEEQEQTGGSDLLPERQSDESSNPAMNEIVDGSIPGRHRIRCRGIGFRPEDQS